MEKYISEGEILDRIRKYREELSKDENSLINTELKPMRLTDRTREKLSNQPRASEVRNNRYRQKYEALREKRNQTSENK
jgi:hypothetical protein